MRSHRSGSSPGSPPKRRYCSSNPAVSSCSLDPRFCHAIYPWCQVGAEYVEMGSHETQAAALWQHWSGSAVVAGTAGTVISQVRVGGDCSTRRMSRLRDRGRVRRLLCLWPISVGLGHAASVGSRRYTGICQGTAVKREGGMIESTNTREE